MKQMILLLTILIAASNIGCNKKTDSLEMLDIAKKSYFLGCAENLDDVVTRISYCKQKSEDYQTYIIDSLNGKK